MGIGTNNGKYSFVTNSISEMLSQPLERYLQKKLIEARAVQKHYDDAIARLYRAIELFAQVRLEKEFGYKTGDLKLEQLPEHLHDEYRCRIRDGKILLGLVEDYELLLKLGDIFGKDQYRNYWTECVRKDQTPFR